MSNVNTVISDKPISHAATPPVLYSNNFSSTNDCTSSGTTVLSLNGGRLQAASMSQYSHAGKVIATVPGRVYRFFFSVDPNGEGFVTPFVRDVATQTTQAVVTSPTTPLTSFIEFTAIGTSTLAGVESSVPGPRTMFLDDMSFQELPTYVYSNGFSRTMDFTGSGTTTLSLSLGQLQCANMSQWNSVSKAIPTIAGHLYRYYFTLSLNNQGGANAFARNVANGANLAVLSVNTNTSTFIEFVATGTSTLIAVESAVTGPRALLLDDVSLRDMSVPTTDYFMADVRQASDYSGFGVQLQGRNLTLTGANDYSYGFQNQEEDDEIRGEGNGVNFKYRMYDPRVGRFFTPDPLEAKYPRNSPYAFSENQVIRYIELEGAEKSDPMDECFDFGASKKGGVGILMNRLFAGVNIHTPQLHLITQEVVHEKQNICSFPIAFKQPEPGKPLHVDVDLGNNPGQVQVNYDMWKVKDILTIQDNSTGQEIANTGPVAGVGNVTLPSGVTNIHIDVVPEVEVNSTTQYDIRLDYVDERVFTEVITKFLGITVSKNVKMQSAERSREMIDRRNNDQLPNNDIPDGARIGDAWKERNGEFPCDPPENSTPIASGQ